MNIGKKRLAAVSTGLLMLGAIGQAHAADRPVDLDVYFMPMHFEFDGKEMAPPVGQQGFLYGDTTYVPLRFVSYALNKSVSWDADTYTVAVTEPKNAGDRTTIEEYILNRTIRGTERKALDWSSLATSTIEVYMSEVQYVFDGVKKQPAEGKPGLLYKDTLYVPIRFLSESLGKEVCFDPETYTVTAVTKEPEEPVKATTPTQGALPSTPVGGVGGIGGVVINKPSYDSLIQEAEGKIRSLENTAQGKMTELLNQYKAAPTLEEKLTIAAQGLSAEASFDAQFNAILSELSSKLSTYGYSTAAVESYRTSYNERKIAEKAKYGL